MQKLTVITPIYTSTLSRFEQLSLRNNIAVLSRHRTVFLVSEELENLPPELAEFPEAEIVKVGSQWLGRANGIAGYNRMMLSREFYEMFASSEYILICQTDAWIFRDEIDDWCNAGYDYIGGPYHKYPAEKTPVIGIYWRLGRLLLGRENQYIKRRAGWGRVMNGGLSLRKTDTFIKACDRYADKIEFYCAHPNKTIYNEDWFWSMLPDLNYPSFDIARAFAIDTHPKKNFKSNDNHLPFGCHGWWKRRRYRFWSPIIESKLPPTK